MTDSDDCSPAKPVNLLSIDISCGKSGKHPRHAEEAASRTTIEKKLAQIIGFKIFQLVVEFLNGLAPQYK